MVETAREALKRAVRALLEMQSPEGWWYGELEANVTIQAEYILLMHFLGLRDDARWTEVTKYIDLRQQEDGGWPIYYQGPSDLSTTIEAYAALKLAGRDPRDSRMQRARDFILKSGGLPKARIFTKIWLALFGEYPWSGLPVMPPELIFFPSWMPLNIYDFSSWARGTVVPLLIVLTVKPVKPLPEHFRLQELREGLSERDYSLPKPKNLLGWRGFFWLADVALRRVSWPADWRRRAIRSAEQWVLDHQEEDGNWGGIQPPWVYSLIALNVLGYPNDHPVMALSLKGMEDFGIQDGEGWRAQPCVSPVWDTALAVIALVDAGLSPDHPALIRSVDWLLQEQVFASGDWQRKAGRTPAGGWAFEFFNDGYPDTDDTAIVVLALYKAGWHRPEVRTAVRKAVRWLEGMRSRNGAWGSFDVDNTRTLVTKIPFADFGETIDPPTEDVTAHVLECLATLGYSPDHPVLAGALDYLLQQQESDGSWWGRWGVNYVYGSGAVGPALRAARFSADHPSLRRMGAWLKRYQLGDGGWGETTASYHDPRLRGAGPSTPSQTGWALLGLISAGMQEDEAAQRGVRYLIQELRQDGTWDEPGFTGTGFPRAFMINYHLYRQYFPVMAMGRWLQCVDDPVHRARRAASGTSPALVTQSQDSGAAQISSNGSDAAGAGMEAAAGRSET